MNTPGRRRKKEWNGKSVYNDDNKQAVLLSEGKKFEAEKKERQRESVREKTAMVTTRAKNTHNKLDQTVNETEYNMAKETKKTTTTTN